MTYVGKPTEQERARWQHATVPPPPPPPPSYYTEPPPPMQLFHILPLYNPRAEATPYFSMFVAMTGLIALGCTAFVVADRYRLKDALEKIEQRQAVEQEEQLQEQVHREFHLFEKKYFPASNFPMESNKSESIPEKKPVSKPAPSAPFIPGTGPFVPWPYEEEEEGAEHITPITSTSPPPR